jgi:glycosyltransferase involved in cell wall biosynthesis
MKRIKVMFDEEIFLLQEYGGISRYFVELIKTFQSHPDLGIDVVLASRYIRSEIALQELRSFGLRKIKRPLGALVYLAANTFRRRGRQSNSVADVVHLTFYVPGYLGRFPGLPKVVTIHDMIPEIQARGIPFMGPHMRKQSFVERAEVVVSVSHKSLSDAKDFFPKMPNSFVTHSGVSSDFGPGILRRGNLPEKYFLYVGQRSGYKDALTAFRAFAEAVPSDNSTHLLLVGGGKLSRRELNLLKQLGVSGKVLQEDMPSDALPSAYANALALVFPSNYEGFGLPLVEAMASGLPVLVADTPVAREVVQDAGHFFRAGDHEALSLLMREVLSSSSAFKQGVSSGLRLSKNYTWLACAQKTAEAYRFAVDQKRKMTL